MTNCVWGTTPRIAHPLGGQPKPQTRLAACGANWVAGICKAGWIRKSQSLQNRCGARRHRFRLRPDPTLKPSELQAAYTVDDNVLTITFDGVSERVIRVAANNTIENLKTVIECLEEFEIRSC
ncbi:hypothetical protein KL930_004825 [Ogataea haglerorum]|nr:hypothetical protein KL951_004629 [Ogataea haglerorum]KAG7773042.1 hypothetical protein KL930_004825 [Ogataea haglerorum]KAG7775709.1 hypothetical protein KL922_004069 [Ogataea haglerorum]